MKIGELVNESNFNIWKSFANEYSNFVNSNFRHFYHLILSVFKFFTTTPTCNFRAAYFSFSC
jgi:hypothetical protein